MLRTSEQLPFEIFKKLIYFASEPDSNPSAILLTLSTFFAPQQCLSKLTLHSACRQFIMLTAAR